MPRRDRIRYAIVGLGWIAQDAVLPAFARCERSELSALVSGNPHKLERFARRHHVKNIISYEQYEDFLASGSVDAVYIALPNHLHREYVEKAARHGVHVLCEKPLAVAAEDCRAMLRACHAARVKLMTAYRLHFDPANLSVIDLVQDQGIVGDPRFIQSTHSQPVEAPNIRTLPVDLGGGPTYDMGIYDINAARYIFRDEPISLVALASRSERPGYEDIEETMSVTLKFPGDRLASLIFGFGTADTDRLTVVGTDGTLLLEPAYAFQGDKCVVARLANGDVREEVFPEHDHFAPEIDYFSECIFADVEPEPSGMEGLLDVRIIEAIHESARSGREIRLDLPRKAIYPDLSMAAHISPARRLRATG